MRKAIRVLFSFCALLPTTVLAAGFGLDDAANKAGYNESATIAGAVSGILTAAFSLIGLLFLGMMLYGGYEWMSSMGEEEKVETGKKTIIWATFGLVVILGAYAITHFIIKKLGG